MTHRPPTTLCQHCDEPKGNHVLAAHERTCKKHPGSIELLRRFDDEGWSIKRIAIWCDVSHCVVERWLRKAGAKRRVPIRHKRKKVVAVWELSVLEPCQGRCDDCGWLFVCRERECMDRPLLSEAPLETELELWAHQGWILEDWKGEGLRNG